MSKIYLTVAHIKYLYELYYKGINGSKTPNRDPRGNLGFDIFVQAVDNWVEGAQENEENILMELFEAFITPEELISMNDLYSFKGELISTNWIVDEISNHTEADYTTNEEKETLSNYLDWLNKVLKLLKG